MAPKTIKRFGGNSIQSSSFRAALISAPLPAAQNVFIAQAQADAQDSGAYTVDVRNLAVGIEILDYAARYALETQLKILFKRGARGDLEATFHDEALDYLLPCTVVNIAQDKDFPQFWTVLFQTGATNWRAVAAATDTWGPSGTSGAKAITVLGKDTTRLSLTITPTVGPASGYLKQELYQLVNVPLIDYGVRPWCVTIDTLALVGQAANKCQINQVSGIDAVVTTIPYDTVTGVLPSAGSGYCGTEQLSWTGKTGTTSGNLTGCTRGINGTTAAVHADNVEIKVSLLQADLNDFRVWIGDKETKRWIDSPASATTKVWFNVEQKPGFDLTLATAVAGSGTVTTLQFAVNATMKARLAAMPATGIVYRGTEWFLYSARDAVLCRLTISKRTFLGTTIAAHSAGATFKTIHKPITFTYGNSTIGNPADDDDHYDDDKPVFNLNLSDNTKWVWTAADKFYDPEYPSRPGSWLQFLKKNGDKTETYYFTANAESGAPALGTDVYTYLKGSVWTGEVVIGGWQFYWTGGISKATMTGRKLRTGTLWGSAVGLQRSVDGKTWAYVVATEATPAVVNVYSTITITDVVTANTTKFLRMGMFGSYGAANNAHMQIEGLTAIVYFVSANIPTGALLGAKDNATLDVTISNAESGDSVRVVVPMLLGQALVINGETNVVTFDEHNAHGTIALDDDSRSEILRLEPGANNLSITSADMGTLDVGLSWYSRRP